MIRKTRRENEVEKKVSFKRILVALKYRLRSNQPKSKKINHTKVKEINLLK